MLPSLPVELLDEVLLHPTDVINALSVGVDAIVAARSAAAADRAFLGPGELSGFAATCRLRALIDGLTNYVLTFVDSVVEAPSFDKKDELEQRRAASSCRLSVGVLEGACIVAFFCILSLDVTLLSFTQM